MSKHTPLPWKSGELETSDGEIYIWTDAEDKFIASVCDEDNDGQDTKANAEFIVRACNAHDDLLAACREVAAYFEIMGPVLGDSASSHDERMLRKRVRDAIQKAEGQSDASAPKVPGVREDHRTGQFYPTVDGIDQSPTFFDRDSAMRQAVAITEGKRYA